MNTRAAFALAVLSSALATGCARSPRADGGPVVALVTTAAGLGDHSYNDAALAALQACRTRTGVTLDVRTARSPDDYEPLITLAATKNADQTIGLGWGMVDPIWHAARRFEKRQFTIVDAVVPMPNVESFTFKVQEGSFLAGALAALVSERRAVAFLGGADVPQIAAAEAGFRAGVRQIDPALPVTVAYAGSFRDLGAGRRAANGLFARGADVAYVVAGPAGLGAIDAARRAHRFVIGADADEDGVAPGTVLTSVVKNVGAAVERACEETAAQKPSSGPVALGLADGGIRLTDFRYTRARIGPARLATVERLRDAVVRGAVVPPSTRAALAHFAPARVTAVTVPGARGG